jgi:rhodanese-related sulfurtransferase
VWRHRRNRSGRYDLWGIALGALAILLGSSTLGIIVNHFSPRGIPIFAQGDRGQLPLPPGLLAISPEEARQMLDDESAVFLDARSPEEYAEGHIRGALSLPLEAFEESFMDVVEQIESAQTAVVYCEGIECADAAQTAERLLEAFPGKVYVMELGWRAWLEAGYPKTEGVQP